MDLVGDPCGATSEQATTTTTSAVVVLPNEDSPNDVINEINCLSLVPNFDPSGRATLVNSGDISNIRVGTSSGPTFSGGTHNHIYNTPPPAPTSPTEKQPEPCTENSRDLGSPPVKLGAAMADWSQVAAVILAQIGSLFKSGSIEIFGRNCYYQSSPRVSKFKLVYDGKVWCPGWTAITGTSTTKSQAGALEHAVKNFVNSIHSSGLVSDQEVQEYLSRFNGRKG